MTRQGGIWHAAKRGEGYQLARESNITWFIVTFAIIFHTIFRFFSGRPLMGDDHRKTDASWSRPGTQLLQPKERAPFGWHNPHAFSWSRLTERRRAAIRIGMLTVAIAIGWGFWDGTPLNSSLIHDAFTIAGVGFTWQFLYAATSRGIDRTRDRRHNRERVNPLKAALAPFLGQHASDINLTLTPRKP